MVEWPLEDTVMVPAGWKQLAWLRNCSQDGVYAPHHPDNDVIYGVSCLMHRIHVSRKSRSRNGSGFFHHWPYNLLADIFLPVPVTLSYANVGKLVPRRGEVSTRGYSNGSFTWMLKLLPDHWGSSGQCIKKQVVVGVTVLSRGLVRTTEGHC